MKVRGRLVVIAALTLSILAPVWAGPVDEDDKAKPQFIAVGYIGATVDAAPEDVASVLGLPRGVGLVVVDVQADAPAAVAGLRPHDVLHKLDDQLLVNVEQFRTLVQGRAGETVKLALFRQGTLVEMDVTVGQTQAPARPVPLQLHGELPLNFSVDLSGENGEPVIHIEQPDGNDEQDPAPGTDDAPVQLRFRPSMNIVVTAGDTTHYKDDQHDLSLTVRDDGKTLVAKDTGGTELFNGPINTPEQRAAVPDPIRQKLDKLEGRRQSQSHSQSPNADPTHNRVP